MATIKNGTFTNWANTNINNNIKITRPIPETVSCNTDLENEFLLSVIHSRRATRKNDLLTVRPMEAKNIEAITATLITTLDVTGELNQKLDSTALSLCLRITSKSLEAGSAQQQPFNLLQSWASKELAIKFILYNNNN